MVAEGALTASKCEYFDPFFPLKSDSFSLQFFGGKKCTRPYISAFCKCLFVLYSIASFAHYERGRVEVTLTLTLVVFSGRAEYDVGP